MAINREKKLLHKNFRNDTLYDSKSFKSVFLMRKPQISTTLREKWRQKPKYQNNAVLWEKRY